MKRFESKISEAGAHVDVTFSDVELAAMGRRLAQRRERSRRVRSRALALALVATMVALVLVVRSVTRAGSPAIEAAGSAASSTNAQPVRTGDLLLADGSLVTVERDAKVLLLSERDDPQKLVRLERGRAHFEVVPQKTGSFKIVVASVLVEVVGTAFDVELRDDEVNVVVRHGTVRVHTPTTTVLLHGGESQWFPATVEPADAASEADRASVVADAAPAPRIDPKGAEWRHLANDGDFDGAYKVLSTSSATVRDEPGDLLLAADVHRLSGHPSDAVAPLKRLVEKFPTDPRAPLAAFTLGRVLLDEVGDPRAAAAAFASTRRLQPGGPLDESALAREIEAWSRAGETQQARALGEEYFRLYPNGSKATLVRKYTD
jgi:transmembrane sensor